MQRTPILPINIVNSFPGIHLEGLMLLASRPGMGNSTFALYVAKEGLENNLSVAFVTYQESKGGVKKQFLERFGDANIDGMSIIDDYPYLSTPLELKGLFERGHDIILIDDIDSAFGRFSLDEQERNNLIQTLYNYSIAYKTPVWLNHSLSSEPEKRGGDCKPYFRDINWCRKLTVLPAQIFSLYRPAYYGFEEDDLGNDILELKELICLKSDYFEKGYYELDGDLFSLGEVSAGN